MQRYKYGLRLYKQMEEITAHLIEGCRQGKRASQLALYKQFAQRLYITCVRITGNQEEAEEAMQDTFLKIFSRLDQYHDSQCFEAWIHRIAIHTAIDYVRRQKPDWEQLPDNMAEQPDDDKEVEEQIHYTVLQVKEGMKKLAAGYRVILSLYLFEGYDMEEIASILNIQPPSVRSQYLRAKRKLLDIIGAN
ncbi:RNA polymerase sigma-70 factor, ECF subfamily [Parabacteroides chinchillae]|uniref:RNA polymerase sigma-70 factor, ECF subfamily n=2 Tax=Tannerellaceae TaxID=2005525 RepID=A0A8G2F2V1_9BACT|nr:RNA polymerase sigma-70 factor, ECF subfamily [Parabacteroides chinchillae]